MVGKNTSRRKYHPGPPSSCFGEGRYLSRERGEGGNINVGQVVSRVNGTTSVLVLPFVLKTVGEGTWGIKRRVKEKVRRMGRHERDRQSETDGRGSGKEVSRHGMRVTSGRYRIGDGRKWNRRGWGGNLGWRGHMVK